MIRNRLKVLGAGIGVLGMVLSLASVAGADIVYDTTNGATVDSPIETMALSVGGANGSTTLQIQLEGHTDGDHPGCNIQGDAHTLTMSLSNSNPAAASAAFAGGDAVFDTCDDILTVVVSPLAVGQTTISFSGVGDTANDPHLHFSYDQAAFLVNVTAATTPPPPVVCDADPAAPAWANAILKANPNMKNKTTVQNTISSVAHHMTQGAMFDGVAKNAHPDYENAVYHYMTTAAPAGLGLSLSVDAQHSARPGWECSTQNS
ncbi:MAG: hypothetical protein LC792_19290 [Actinobacteria bacterium]|nr:hypothetical protein [Actinomycetota bacterium]